MCDTLRPPASPPLHSPGSTGSGRTEASARLCVCVFCTGPQYSRFHFDRPLLVGYGPTQAVWPSIDLQAAYTEAVGQPSNFPVENSDIEVFKGRGRRLSKILEIADQVSTLRSVLRFVEGYDPRWPRRWFSHTPKTKSRPLLRPS